MGNWLASLSNKSPNNQEIWKAFNVSDAVKEKIKDTDYYVLDVDDTLLKNNEKFNSISQNRKFESSYTCGDSNLNKEIITGNHQQAIYDCIEENKLCESSKLELKDDGTLTLYSGQDYNNIRWSKKFKTGDVD